MLPKSLDKSKLVHKSGVYKFFDQDGNLLYVGKAIDLNKRVASYFNRKSDSFKTDTLVSKIATVDTIVVESELEALILEANLIKQLLPPFNIRLTDDKDYLYIKITKEQFPRVLTARKPDLGGSLDYFGPFPSSTVVKKTVKSLRRIFPWCSAPSKQLTAHRSRLRAQKPCFYYHLGLCPGACVGKISAKDYRKIINQFRSFMQGKVNSLVDDLEKTMIGFAKKQQYEQANQVKKMIDGISYVTSPNRVAMYLENPNFLENQTKLALADLQAKLGLPELPQRIECYDISNIQGKNATGSMVVLTDGEIDKSQYRRFKILIAGKPNDYAMHQEMMHRRLNHPEWPLPNLFLIDGGRGQVRASGQEIQKQGINRPIYGIAKRMEWLYPIEGEVIKIPKNALSLRLIQKIRDEAHRFAITYHKKLRQHQFLTQMGS